LPWAALGRREQYRVLIQSLRKHTNRNLPDLTQAHLDRGERDTLALDAAIDSSLVLLNEAEDRQSAHAGGLRVRGSLGVLIDAYQRDLIGADQLRLAFAEIVRRRGIWINPAQHGTGAPSIDSPLHFEYNPLTMGE
jgi:predicted nucleic acid-binding protein